ncbi:MAG TPA: energy transducer TonB [Novosphingobium sp.]|nr:energy transducer TonB [Novosphingobium sp.]
MSFVEQRRGRSNAAVIAVAGLHGLAIYALITGFGVDYIKDFVPAFKARNIPADPTPPDPAPRIDQKTRPDESRTTAPPTATVFRTDTTRFVDPIDRIPLPPIEPFEGPAFDPVPPQPTPSFTPVSAQPSNNPSRWVTTSDYPTQDLRLGNQGAVRFELAIGANGKVTGCTITQSSGHVGLDTATCKYVASRARFKPAIDSSGANVAATYSGRIVWVIPD